MEEKNYKIGYFDARRKKLLSDYGKALKAKYPMAKYRVAESMTILFPKEKRYRSLKLSGVYNDWDYFSEKVERYFDDSNHYEYNVSIFKHGTLVVKLKPLSPTERPVTDRQIDTLMNMLIIHNSYHEIPYNLDLKECMTSYQAHQLISALLINKKVAVVINYEKIGGEQQ